MRVCADAVRPCRGAVAGSPPAAGGEFGGLSDRRRCPFAHYRADGQCHRGRGSGVPWSGPGLPDGARAMKYAFLTLLLLNILYALWQWQERVPEAGPPAPKTAEQATAAPLPAVAEP